MLVLRLSSRLASLAAALVVCACHTQAAVTTPSGEQAVFAEAYPARANQVRSDFAEQEQKAKASLANLRTPPASLRDSERPVAKGLFERADRAGRSGYYADEAVRQEALDDLFEEGRGGLRRRVAGSVAYQVKQKKCGEVDCPEELASELGNAAAYAAERALDKQQEQRLDAHNEAAHYLDAHAAELSARSLEALTKQSRALARTSFVVHVRLELYRRELEALLEEEQSASSTLERSEADARAQAAQSGISKQQKAALERRVAELSAKRAELTKELPLAQSARDAMNERIEALHTDYAAALQELLAALDQPAPAGAKPPPATTPPAATPPAAKPPAAKPPAATPAAATPAATTAPAPAPASPNTDPAR